MQTPRSKPVSFASQGAAGVTNTHHSNIENAWCCCACGKTLGVRRGARMHLRFSRGHEYLTGYPVQATCRGCRTINELTGPTTR